MAADLEPLTGSFGRLMFGLVLHLLWRGTSCQLLNSMHHSLLQEVLAEDVRQLMHQDFSQLQGFGHDAAVLLGEQASNEAGNGQVSQCIAQGFGLAEVQDLCDSRKALGAHLQVDQALTEFLHNQQSC